MRNKKSIQSSGASAKSTGATGNNSTDHSHETLDATPNGSAELSFEDKMNELQRQLEQVRLQRIQLEIDSEKQMNEILIHSAAAIDRAERGKEETEKKDHHLFKTVLSQEQILDIQDEIYDFFTAEPLEDWKWDLQTFFSGWVASEYSTNMDNHDRGERVFSYHFLVKLIERLAPFAETIEKALSEKWKNESSSEVR